MWGLVGFTLPLTSRFHHYDCLVMPVSALSGCSSFLWEKVSLLIEYEQLKRSLFEQSGVSNGGEREILGEIGCAYEESGDSAGIAERLHLQDYITLRTAQELTVSSISAAPCKLSWWVAYVCVILVAFIVGDGTAYTVVASERVTGNPELLQLLEARLKSKQAWLLIMVPTVIAIMLFSTFVQVLPNEV